MRRSGSRGETGGGREKDSPLETDTFRGDPGFETHVWRDAADVPLTSSYKLIPVREALYVLAGNNTFYHYNSHNDHWDPVTETSPFEGSLTSKYVTVDANVAMVCQYV